MGYSEAAMTLGVVLVEGELGVASLDEALVRVAVVVAVELGSLNSEEEEDAEGGWEAEAEAEAEGAFLESFLYNVYCSAAHQSMPCY